MFIYVALGVAFIFHCQKGKAALLLAAYIVHTLKKEGKNIKRSCAMDELAGTAASKGASYLFFFLLDIESAYQIASEVLPDVHALYVRIETVEHRWNLRLCSHLRKEQLLPQRDFLYRRRELGEVTKRKREGKKPTGQTQMPHEQAKGSQKEQRNR